MFWTCSFKRKRPFRPAISFIVGSEAGGDWVGLDGVAGGRGGERRVAVREDQGSGSRSGDSVGGWLSYRGTCANVGETRTCWIWERSGVGCVLSDTISRV